MMAVPWLTWAHAAHPWAHRDGWNRGQLTLPPSTRRRGSEGPCFDQGEQGPCEIENVQEEAEKLKQLLSLGSPIKSLVELDAPELL